MGKRHRTYDMAGNKLFGRCVAQGECVCGNCLNAPINQSDAVTVTRPDGSVEQVRAPVVLPEEGATSWAFPGKARSAGGYTLCKAHGKPLNNMHMRKCSERPPGQSRPAKPKLTPAATCGYCHKRGAPCVRHGGARSGVYTSRKSRGLEALSFDPPPVAVEPDSQPEIPVTAIKPPIPVDLSSLRHEVTIKLAGVEINIRPLQGNSQ